MCRNDKAQRSHHADPHRERAFPAAEVVDDRTGSRADSKRSGDDLGLAGSQIPFDNSRRDCHTRTGFDPVGPCQSTRRFVRMRVLVTSSKTACGTMTRPAPTACRRSIRPAFPRKINGEALTTRTSGIAQLSGEIILVDNEDIHASARQLGEELSPTHAGGLGRPLHRHGDLLIPMDRRGDSDLSRHFMRRLAERSEKTLRHRNLYTRHGLSCLQGVNIRVRSLTFER